MSFFFPRHPSNSPTGRGFVEILDHAPLFPDGCSPSFFAKRGDSTDAQSVSLIQRKVSRRSLLLNEPSKGAWDG